MGSGPGFFQEIAHAVAPPLVAAAVHALETALKIRRKYQFAVTKEKIPWRR